MFCQKSHGTIGSRNQRIIDSHQKEDLNLFQTASLHVPDRHLVDTRRNYTHFCLRQPGIQKANDAIGAADLELALGNDSTAMAKYMDLADNGSYEASNRAALPSAILLYEKGDYEKALKYVDSYSPTEEIIGAGAKSLKGDCLVNLDRLDEAVKAYKDAVSRSDNNPAYTPFFLMKLARVYAAQGNHKDEADTYQTILTDYPLYGQAHNIDVEKLLNRARLQAK